MLLLTRTHRRRLSGWLVAAMLLVQALVFGHACAAEHAATPAEATAAAHTGAGCDGAFDAADEAAVDGALCAAHCDPTAQRPPLGGALDVPPVVALPLLAPPVLAMGEPPARSSAHAQSVGAPPPGWPPLYLLHRVLRT